MDLFIVSFLQGVFLLVPYSNFFSRILLLVLGLSQISGGPVKKNTL